MGGQRATVSRVFLSAAQPPPHSRQRLLDADIPACAYRRHTGSRHFSQLLILPHDTPHRIFLGLIASRGAPRERGSVARRGAAASRDDDARTYLRGLVMARQLAILAGSSAAHRAAYRLVS